MIDSHIEFNRIGRSRVWYNNNSVHREDDGPSIEYCNGNMRLWYKHGSKHRDGDLPAVERDGDMWKEWWKNGQRHRDNGPAIEFASGKRVWYTHDEFIRSEPAAESNGY